MENKEEQVEIETEKHCVIIIPYIPGYRLLHFAF
jgi:hypothetical protein